MDYIVMARALFTSEDILTYHIVSKLFTGCFVMHGALMQAVWPTCSEMIAGGKMVEVRALLRRYCLYGIGFVVVVTMGIALFSPQLCKLFFVKQSVTIPCSLVLFLGFYYVIRSLCDPYAMALQSMNRLRPLLVGVPLQALMSFLGQTVFAKFWGVHGITMGLIFSYLITVSWFFPLLFQRYTRDLALKMR
jgi:O-antigen/teichoic acid export membrane protein